LLLELSARGLGIIEEIGWSLSPGLNIITGETGAGKSLVIDALEALLGSRVEADIIRYGDERAHVEGVFALPPTEGMARLKQLMAARGLGVDEDTLVISFELRRQGRGIIRVNGQAVPRALLQQIGSCLVDIHGQSEHLSLLDRRFHLDFLDSYAHTLDQRRRFAAKATELRRLEQEIKALAEEGEDRARREELLRFQLDEIGRAELREGEEEELIHERNILTSCEQLKALSYQAYQALYGGEDAARLPASAIDRLQAALQVMKKLAELDPALKQQLESLEEAAYSIEEIGRDIHAYSDRLEYDPARLEAIELRLELIRGLKRKYGPTIAEVLDYQARAEKELTGITHSVDRKAELDKACSRLREEMGRQADELSRARAQMAAKLVAEVKRELGDLNMSQVRFEVAISRSESEQGIPFPDGKTYAFSDDGVDGVEFVASTNPGEPLQPLARIASTGEASRFMLALKGALAGADNIPVLVFDEIDIGVGGRSGEIVGRRLWGLAQGRQVICVTHLPQIAAYADAHYHVRKEVSGERTVSRLETLHGEARLRELAAMLGGPQYTATSLSSAGELVQQAEAWKESRRS